MKKIAHLLEQILAKLTAIEARLPPPTWWQYPAQRQDPSHVPIKFPPDFPTKRQLRETVVPFREVGETLRKKQPGKEKT